MRLVAQGPDPRISVVRFDDGTGEPVVGVRTADGVHPLPGVLIADLLRTADGFNAAVAAATTDPATQPIRDLGTEGLLAPVDGAMEVWAAGVTYERSREARVAESDAAKDVYERVYDAARPELFFKAVAWRVVGPGQAVTVRRDAHVSVPEPEVGLVVSGDGVIVGLTICNDMSSRDIEAENPLYLPQAKMWLGSTAVGPALVPIAEVADPYDLAISMSVERSGAAVFQGSASTAQLHRRYDDLVGYLVREDHFPGGAILATGTSIVPELDFTLMAGDRITIEVSGVGTLLNTVACGATAAGVRLPHPNGLRATPAEQRR